MKVLFIGYGTSPTVWYRCALPAKALGYDWCGVDDEFHVLCGEFGDRERPVIQHYDTVVVQMASGDDWLRRILTLRNQGIRVLYEVDDYLHGVRYCEEHRFKEDFTRGHLRLYESCMAACDGMIVSTKFLEERYKKLCPGPVYLCQNGIDLPRFKLNRAKRDFMTVGWAGGVGHVEGLLSWLNGGILDVFDKHPTARFTTVGMARPLAEELHRALPGRTSHVPWSPFEYYPAALADASVIIAPAGTSAWHRGKSDLRWLEASALGLPSICDFHTYPEAWNKTKSPKSAADKLDRYLRKTSYAGRDGAFERQNIIESGRTFPAAAKPWKLALTNGR